MAMTATRNDETLKSRGDLRHVYSKITYQYYTLFEKEGIGYGEKQSTCACSNCSKQFNDEFPKNQVFLSELYQQCTQKAGCDVTLVVDDGTGKDRFPTHRVVLAANSMYFDAMFQYMNTRGLMEAHQSEIHVRLPTLRTEPFEKILKFFYTGTIWITGVDVQDILETSNYLLVDAVCQIAGRFMSENMTCDNCLGILQLADNLAQTELYADAADFVRQNFTAVIFNESFFKNPYATSVITMTNLAEILSGDKVHLFNHWDRESVPILANMERRLLAFILRYAKENDLECLPKLLRTVRLPQLLRSDLCHLAEHPLIRRSSECQKLVNLALAMQRGFDMAHEKIEPSWNRLRDVKGCKYEFNVLRHVSV